MEYIELNPEGNYEGWDKDKLEELESKNLNDIFGILLFENELIAVSELTLPPYARIPFRKRKHNYSATCLTDGLVISRNGNGKISMVRFREGDIVYWKFKSTAAVTDLQNISNSPVKAIVIAYKTLKSIVGKFSIHPQK